MSLYGHMNLSNEDYEGVDMDKVVESFFYDDLSRLDHDQVHEFIESAQCQALLERQVLNKPALMRLDKQSDAIRRTRLMCYTLAQQAHDPEWEKCKKYRSMWKASRSKIFKKYGNKATRLAKIAQKEYLKSAKSQKATPDQIKAQNAH